MNIFNLLTESIKSINIIQKINYDILFKSMCIIIFITFFFPEAFILLINFCTL